jgi:hypothetical protein
MRDFREVLVLRSFRKYDPLRLDLENAIRAVSISDGSKLPVRFVDIEKRVDFVNAMNAFDGALAIFDGHGSHTANSDIAALQLSGGPLNVWELRNEVRMPPLFFACACSTHALSRSHVTTANGLLNCGVRSVIASLMPIHSKVAALFAMRMLLQLYQLWPAILEGQLPHSIRWDEAFGFIQRMMYVSECLDTLFPMYDKWPQERIALQSDCTTLIYKGQSDWFEDVIERIAIAFNVTSEVIVERLRSKLPFPEVLKYLQIGNPESVVIGPESPTMDWILDVDTDNNLGAEMQSDVNTTRAGDG